MSAVVRVPDASEANVLHALDSGASGVQVPSLRSAAEAQDVVRLSKYHPVGERGWAPGCRAGDYAFTPAQSYIEQANRDTLVVVHVENAHMVEDIEALCRVEHLDVLPHVWRHLLFGRVGYQCHRDAPFRGGTSLRSGVENSPHDFSRTSAAAPR